MEMEAVTVRGIPGEFPTKPAGELQVGDLIITGYGRRCPITKIMPTSGGKSVRIFTEEYGNILKKLDARIPVPQADFDYETQIAYTIEELATIVYERLPRRAGGECRIKGILIHGDLFYSIAEYPEIKAGDDGTEIETAPIVRLNEDELCDVVAKVDAYRNRR